MSGTSVFKNGVCLVEGYGIDLDKLNQDDRVGLMRTSEVYNTITLIHLTLLQLLHIVNAPTATVHTSIFPTSIFRATLFSISMVNLKV